jgi:hypothetical protein
LIADLFYFEMKEAQASFEGITERTLSVAFVAPALLTAIYGVRDELSVLGFDDLFCAAISLAFIQGVKHLYGERIKELIQEQKLAFNRLDEECRNELHGQFSSQFEDWTRRAACHANHVLDFGLGSAVGGYVLGEVVQAVCGGIHH